MHFRILLCLYKEIECITPCFVLSALEPINVYLYRNEFSFCIFFYLFKLKYFFVNFNSPSLVGQCMISTHFKNLNSLVTSN